MKVLDGIKVLDLGAFITGPYAAMLLADLGCNVTKIERPGTGDPFRGSQPSQYSPQFQAHNWHKRSVTLDFTRDEGRAILLRMVEGADVVVVNHRVGVGERHALDYSTLSSINPRLIYCAITGFGPTGPYASRPAFDTVGQSLSGWINLFRTSDDPRIAGPAVCDAFTGMFAAYGILGALYERERTGRGRLVEINMLEATLAFAIEPLGYFFANRKPPHPYSRAAVSQAFILTCSDRRRIGIHLSVVEKFWQNLMQALGSPAIATEVRFRSGRERIENYTPLAAALAEEFRKQPQDVWARRLEEADVPFAPVREFDELAEDPQIQTLDSLFSSEHPRFGPVRGVRRPVRYDGDREIDARPPPALGEHTDEVLEELGLSVDEIAALRNKGIA
jgi:crotonobetainyl-CoA:carnitine CoA-transferase CaiB-like acyl-CoA transferase